MKVSSASVLWSFGVGREWLVRNGLHCGLVLAKFREPKYLCDSDGGGEFDVLEGLKMALP